MWVLRTLGQNVWLLALGGCLLTAPSLAEENKEKSDSSHEQHKVGSLPQAEPDPDRRHQYFTHGVHNDVGCEPREKCIAERDADDPPDPHWPKWWISDWTMYRVFDNYRDNPPPYDAPPAVLSRDDYEISTGTSYYDATYVPPDGDGHGAMMEHYEKRCLPIFPQSNHYTCSFVSLGNKAYVLRYDDRPEGTPACCQFSLHNHAPRRNFVKHLPYDAKRSEHLGGSVQAYAFELASGGEKILFGYAFERDKRPDDYDESLAPYQHPQSFYFSGSPTKPPDAPVVSQNYRNFRAQRPDPSTTWQQVHNMCPAEPPWCCLFAGDCPDEADVERAPSADEAGSWADLEPLDH